MGGTKIEVVAELALLISFLLGFTGAVLGCVVHGSKHAALLEPDSDDLISRGVRVILGLYTRDDDGYLESLLHGRGWASVSPRANDSSAWPGHEVDQ